MRVRAVDVARFGALMSAMWVVVAVHGADSSAGRAKTEVCTTCHGTDGHSPNPLIPSLAGQPPLYIYYQLLQFREHRRINELMSPFAAKLTDTDMKDIAAYYSEQKALGPSPTTDQAGSESGQAVVARNHCDSCHTSTFAGQNQIPRLAGLPYDYLVKQLRGFKSGERSDIDGTMSEAAQPLSDQDITDVSRFLAGLR
ncbi:MAG TPA: c-type cytochrome [Burkholderiaceae bacterium]|jgi:cytochrome c553|nr:c-type cytochrome [Burkholderiaceae bacterium]